MASSTGDRDPDHSAGKRKDKTKEKTRRPADTPFRQQRLKAWQPVITAKSVLPLFFAVGIIFAPLGGLLLYASSQVQQLAIDYTGCNELTPGANFTSIPTDKFTGSFKTDFTQNAYPLWKFATNQSSNIGTAPKLEEKVCTLQFTLPNDLKPPVFMYYRLTSFYQNHRRYVQSLDESQLRGDAVSASSLHGSDSCNPLILDENGKPYYPCGLIANSVFNDSFTSPVAVGSQASNATATYNMTTAGINWDADKQRFGKTKYNASDVVPPPNWQLRYPGGYTDETLFNPEDDPGFQVWMRTAGLPTFSKLARRNDSSTMAQGTYQIDIYYRFLVSDFGGTKEVIITTRTVMGGKNPFLGIAYIAVGSVCIILGALFTAYHFLKPRRLGDHVYLSWNNANALGHAAPSSSVPVPAASEPATAAVATGSDLPGTAH